MQDEAYFRWARPEILPHLPQGPLRLLDVGCGAGGVLATVKSAREVTWAGGAELFPDAAEAARAVFDRVWEGDLAQVDPAAEIEAGSLDLILCLDILEHLQDPWDLVRRLSPLLAPGGRLIVSVPNIRNWKFIWRLLTRGDFRYRDKGLLDRTHLRFFVHETAAELAEAGGLRAVHVGSATEYKGADIRRALVAAGLEKLVAKQILVVASPA